MKFLLLTSTLFLLATANASDRQPLNELIIKVKKGESLPALTGDLRIQNLFGEVFIARGADLAPLEAKLKNHPSIEYTERNRRAEKSPLPTPFTAPISADKGVAASEFNDPFVGRIWSFLDASENGISVDAAYQNRTTNVSDPIIVAIVDTGIDAQHEDLKDVLWTNTKEIPGNGIDDDNNGYVDDVHGINTLVRDSAGRATGNNKDMHSHGTHVAGTIGAKQNNSTGIAGIASNVKLMAIRSVPNDGDETDINVAESFIYAAKNGAKIINCSFGKNKNEGGKLIPDTLKFIQDNYGVLVVAAAGNDGYNIDTRPTYPASHSSDNLLIIASTDDDGEISGFSNFGKKNVDVAAPGNSIYSTTPGNRYQSMSGTSMASPTAAGVAAEVLSQNPKLSPLELKDVLIRSVTIVPDFKNKMVSGGRIDLLRALEIAKQLH